MSAESAPKPLAEADAWLRVFETFWNDRLDGLDSLLREEDEAAARKPKGETS